MILQAYDFYQLFKNNNCILQIGGSDQWGNIVNGVDLIRRKLKKEAYGLTSINYISLWSKNGEDRKRCDLVKWKSTIAIWLLAIWRNTDDRDVKRFLNFTELEPKEINTFLIKRKI